MSDLSTYHTWNIAAVRFSATPDALTAEQEAYLIDEVGRALALETRILEAPEAEDITVSLDCVSDAANQWREENSACSISDAVLMEALSRELRVQALLDAIASLAPKVNKKDAHEYFYANPMRFCKPERRVVRHILTTVNPDYVENTEEAARSRVDSLVMALETGAVFSELAARHSECPTAMQGGLVGTVAEGALYPEVDAAAFALAAGEWSGPVRTELGWHLVLCEAIFPAEPVSFEALEPEILEYLRHQARRLAQTEWLRRLSSQTVTAKCA